MSRKMAQVAQIPIFAVVFLAFYAVFLSQELNAGEPQHEYEKPGFHEGHAYDGLLPEESIDLFTGGLLISQQDFHINNISGIDNFESMFTRRYSSKVFRQEISGGTCNATTQSIDDEFAGQGWTVHFGRLWDWNQFGIPNGHPVLELPNGSRHVFSIDSEYSDRYIARSGWTLQLYHVQFPLEYIACSPGPDSVCIRFGDNTGYTDVRNGRQVMHAKCWFYAGWTVGTIPGGHQEGSIFFYDRDAAGHVWPKEIWQNCYNMGDPKWIIFNWNPALQQPTMDSITTYATDGSPVTYSYQYITQNGHILMSQSSTPQGKTYKYEYDPSTNELIRIKISTDSTVDSSDLVIEYDYETKIFPIHPLFVSQACTRAIVEKRVSKVGGGFDTWTYDYPSAAPHKVTVTDPKGNKREVTFEGYSTSNPVVWNVGNILRDEIFEGTTSLISQVSTYDFKQVTTALDPEAASQDTIKIPVVLSTTKTYPQTGQQTVTSYGTAANYDRYGNPDFKQEKNFDGSVLRTTEYQYEHRDGDVDDDLMEESHYVRDLSKIKVLDSAGLRVSEVSFEHFNQPGDVRFGVVENELTWDSESNSNIRTTYDYSWRRERDKIYQQTESGTDWLTESWNGICNGRTWWWIDALDTEAGPLFNGELSTEGWKLIKHHGASFEPPTTFAYDTDMRLTQIAPPAGDTVNITYDDLNRKVTVAQGSANTIESYDNRGRLTQRETKITATATSKQTFEYDEFNNVTNQSEKTLNPTPDTFITKTYDGLNRVKSITTADGITNYTYNGPDVTINVNSELGLLTTVMKYDAAGRLTKVTEPNAKATTYAYDVLDRLIRVCHDDNDDICTAGHANRRDFVYSSRGKLLSETHPESGATSYKYDMRGRMVEKRLADMNDPLDEPIRFEYDNRNRLLSIGYPNDPTVSFYYDGSSSTRPVPGYETEFYQYPRGHLTGMVDSTGTTLWTFHNSRRQIEQRDLHLTDIANPILLNYTYDTRGNLDSIKYPSGQTVFTPRNDANAISQITRQFDVNPVVNLLNSVSYNAAFLPNNFSYANGVTLGVTSDVRNRPDVMNSAGKLTLDYNYNARGLISSIATAQNGGGSQPRTITYDNLGRLTAFNANGPTVNYGFDIFGNLLSKTGALSAGPFTYSNNRINGVSYSAPGNQLSANGKTLTYNEENRLVQVTGGGTNTTYSYDGNGNRVKSVDAVTGKIKYFIYDEAGTLLAEMSQASGGPLYIDKEYINGPSGTLVTAALDEIPRDLKVFDLNGKNRVQWTASSSCNITGYNVYRSNTEFGTYALLNTSGPVSTGFYDDGGLPECTLRYYKIKAVYTGGLEGAFSEPIGHWFLHQRSVLYNSPSPSPAPLTVTYTYNKGGGCSSAAPTGYSLNYGDGSSQNFGTNGSVTHNYTTASSCYPFCIATLTVTWNNGVTSTASVLTDMSNTVMQDENFTDGVANGYTVVNGTWAVNSGLYNGQNSGTSWAVSKSSVPCNNCVIRADGLTVNTTGSRNAYIIFSYVDPLNFRYAGFDIVAGRWLIGDVINGTATTRSFFAQTLASNTWYAMELRLDAATKVATLRANGITRVMWAFSTMYSLPAGVGVRGGQSNFDNIKITPPMIVTTLHQEDLSDGVANGYVPAAGTWSIVSGRYRGTIATATDAASVSPVASFNSGIILADIRVVTNNGWVLFDYVNATNFKFAGVDAAGDKWIIGDVINGVKVNRATATQVLNTNTSYPVKVLLEGATVTLINTNAIKVRYTFASLTARPVALGLRGSGTSDFDNIKVCTETYPTGAVGNPPAIPPPTSTAGPADVAAFSYANPPFYYNLNDHLGSTRITINAAGTTTASFEYWPFGEVKSQTGCAANNQKFTGKLFDNESGLQYFGARYLSNDLTRFTSVDPSTVSISSEKPQSWNRYAYVQNNPMTYVDPNGKWLESAADVASLGLSLHAVYQDPYSSINYLAVTADVITLILPVAVAGGAVVLGTKALVKSENAADLIFDSRKAAFKDAKLSNDIPVSKQPDKVIKPGTPEGDAARLDERNVRLYEYTNSKGEKVQIREDKPSKYKEGGKGDQGPHFNSGKKGEKLKNHHEWKDKKKE